VYNLHVDIPTLNSQIGKLYDLEEDSSIEDAIENASAFFDEVLDNEILVIRDKLRSPTEITNEVINYVETLGTRTSKQVFEYDEEYDNSLTYLVVDSVEDFSNDVDGFGTISGEALDDKFKTQLHELKSIYSVSAVLSVPSKVGYVRTAKDTEPHRRHLGNYIKAADKGICIYNSIAEKNVKFYDAEEAIYTTGKGNVLLRTWHVIRNSDGIDSAYDRMFFLPGTSFMIEHDKTEPIDDVSEILTILDAKTPFFNG
jgi:hypothetical protein